MRIRRLVVAATVLTLSLATPKPAQALIHEIIAALCRSGGEEVVPPGQENDARNSFVRALLATGFITSIDTSDPLKIIFNFDPTIPNSKYKSAGFDLTIPLEGGVSLILHPFVIPDDDFPAHANCHNLK
jgi:hypothetical protein